MEVKLQEVVPETNTRTAAGRVVINPPKVTGSLKLRTTGSLTMCCNRAFLTKESYSKHLAEKTEHSKPIDPSKFPKINPYDFEYLPKALHDRSSREFWLIRKKGTAIKMHGIEEEDEECDKSDDDVQKITLTDVDKAAAKGKWKRCGICNLSVMKGNMQRHNEKCHSDGQYKCQHCPCTFEVDSSRKAHQKRKHRINRPPVVNLQKTLLARVKKQLVSLKSKGRGRTYHECPHCGKTMSNIVNFSDHLNTHSGERPYKCDVCGCRFRHDANRRRHMRVAHPEDGKYFCSICKCRFSSAISLGAHNRSVHSDKREAKSPKITKITPIKNRSLAPNPKTVLPQLKLQYPAPNSLGMYECHICHKELTSSQTWRGHMLIHQNLKPYKCKLCGIHFRLHGTMSNHMKVAHSGGSFRCKTCCCRYTNARALDRHNKLHLSKTKGTILKSKAIESEKKPGSANDENTIEVSTNFKCDLCGMMTNDQHLYKDHLLLHSQNSKNRCDLCLKVFSGSAHVQLHKQRAHGKGVHKCSFCCCRYSNSQALFKHLKNEHGMERKEWNVLSHKLTPEGRRRIQSILVQTSASKVGDEKHDDKEKEEFKERSQPELLEVERKYPCDICHKRFIWKGSVFNHKKHVHGIAGKYQCLKCSHKFSNKSLLATHEKLVHRVAASSKQTKQTSYAESSGNKIEEAQPLKSQNLATTENPRKKYRCDLCPMKFINRGGVAHHKKKCHFHKGVIKCSQCSCKFITTHGLVVHRVQAHGYMSKKKMQITQELAENIQSSTQMISANAAATTNRSSKKFYCNECGKFIIGTFAYRAHVRSHGSDKMFECDICHMKFHRRQCVVQHKKRSHNHTGKVQCPMCPCRFITIGGLSNHQKHFHGLVGRKTITKLTNGSAGNVSLNSNQSASRRDESIKKFKTQNTADEATGKSRSDKKEFVLQSETYDRNQDKQYECNICNARFQHRSSILKHKKTAHFHNGTIKCPDCVCRFLTPNSMVLHRRNQHELNMGEIKMLIVSKPLVQKLSTFKKAKKVLKNTLSRTRKDLIPGNCDICGITIRRKTYIKKHKEVAHTNGKYPCTKCCCTFHTMVGLGKHRMLHKPGYHGRKKIEGNRRVLEMVEPKEDQPENHSPKEDNSSDSPTSKVNLNFLKIRGSSLSSKRSSSFNPPNSPVKTLTPKLSELVNGTEGSEPVYPSKPPRGALAASAYRFKCKMCGIRFSETTSLRRHMAKAHTNGTVQCDLCSCKFESNIGLAAHKRVYHNSTLSGAADRFKHNKPQPQKSTDSDKNLDRMKVSKVIDNTNSVPKTLFGKLRQTSGKRVKCKICSIAFSARSLLQHMKKAHTNGSFRCLKCSCTFSNIYSLTAHKRVHHNFSRNKKLPKANTVKFNKKKQPTDVSQPGLTANLRTSTRRRDKLENTKTSDNETVQDTPNAENVISTRVRTPSNVATSEVTLTRIPFKKPVKIPSTSKTFKAPGSFKYPCGFCVKSFANETLLNRHLKCHTRPEQCTQCSMRFRTRDEVAKHVSISHGDGIHQCYACPCRFTSTNGLKMHLKLIHERQSQSYDDIVIEQHEDLADGEPIFNGFLKPPCPQSLPTDDDDFVEDSVPIIEGMIETTYSVANGQSFFRETRTISSDLYYSVHDENFVDESEPIIQGILTLDSNPSVHEPHIEPPPPPQQKRKAFSPKSRPMKCSTCDTICYGPEKLRQHMESHIENDPLAVCNGDPLAVCNGDPLAVCNGDPLADCNGGTIEPVKCSKCNLEFTTIPDLMEHLQVDHDVSGLYKCVYCPCSMKTEAALQSHFMKYHSING